MTFTWSVVSPSTITGVTTPFTTTTGATITSQALAYSCPTARGMHALSGAPTGIGLGTTSGNTASSSVTVLNTSGTLYLGGTVAGGLARVVPVKMIPVDNVSTATGTVTAAWTRRSRPTPSAPVAIKTSVGATIADQSLTYTCPSANCTYTFTSGPDGIGLEFRTEWLSAVVGHSPCHHRNDLHPRDDRRVDPDRKRDRVGHRRQGPTPRTRR